MDINISAEKQQKPLIHLLSNRIVVLLVLAYISGIIVVRFFLEEMSGEYWLAGILLFLLAAGYLTRFFDLYMVVLILVVAAAGGVAFFYAVQQPAGGLVGYTDFPVYAEGTVIDEPLFHEDHTAYRLKVEVVETREGRFSVSGTLLVKIYGAQEESYWFGERLRLRGMIVEPRGQRNPGGFNYRLFLRSQGIDALIYPKPALVSSLGRGNLNFLALSSLEMRSAMVGAISATLPSPSAELLTAILFGQRHRLPEQVEHNFRRAGASHLMAVSGLHVGLAAALILGLWRRLKLKGRLPLILAIIFVFAYAYITGMRPSALRAAIMVSTALAALLLDREQDLPTAVAFAALVTLFLNPLLLFSVGFQLSYAATLSLIYAHRPLKRFLTAIRCPEIISPFVAVTLAAQIGVLPLSLYYFHYIPTGALFFNLLLLPLISFVVGLGLTGALISLVFPLAGDLLIWASYPLLELMLFITGLSSLPALYIAHYPPGITLLLLYYGLLSVLLIIYYRWDKRPGGEERGSQFNYLFLFLDRGFLHRRGRLPFAVGTVLILAVVIVWSGILFPAQKLLKLNFIDVGQGAAALIETPCGKIIMVDAGGEAAYRGDPAEIGQRVLLPLLRHEDVRHIDLAIISHPHEDHFGGFISLIEEITVERFLISPIPGESPYYEQLLLQGESTGIAITTAKPGLVWFCGDNLFLEIIGPPEKLLQGTKSDMNNNSIVFILNYGEVRILFAGDIEDAAVNELLRSGVNLKADLLLVPHHGGYMESMPELMKAVQPSLVVIPVGQNSFGHPHPFVIESLEKAGVEIYRTDHHGAVIVEADGFSFTAAAIERQAMFWQ
jgi:competence protein ComEC